MLNRTNKLKKKSFAERNQKPDTVGGYPINRTRKHPLSMHSRLKYIFVENFAIFER